jgi:hypothetical protein
MYFRKSKIDLVLWKSQEYVRTKVQLKKSNADAHPRPDHSSMSRTQHPVTMTLNTGAQGYILWSLGTPSQCARALGSHHMFTTAMCARISKALSHITGRWCQNGLEHCLSSAVSALLCLRPDRGRADLKASKVCVDPAWTPRVLGYPFSSKTMLCLHCPPAKWQLDGGLAALLLKTSWYCEWWTWVCMSI